MKNSTMNQAKGKMREMKGRVKEGFGEMTNNQDVEARGKGRNGYYTDLNHPANRKFLTDLVAQQKAKISFE